jgi:hypothetical protein
MDGELPYAGLRSYFSSARPQHFAANKAAVAFIPEEWRKVRSAAAEVKSSDGLQT